MKMFRLAVILLSALSAVTIAAPSRASGIVCPVCGQTMDEGTAVCPNDGTDLKLLGRSADKNADKNTDKDTDTETDSDQEGHDNTGKHSDAAKSDASQGDTAVAASRSNGGYKRHDEDRERKATEEKESVGYSDRRSRLPKDTRTAAVPIRRKKMDVVEEPSQPEIEDDTGFFADYEKKRRFLWNERLKEKAEAAYARKDRAAARERLLSSLAAPITSLGMRMFFLGEGTHIGPVSGAEIDIQLARYRLRAGFSTFVGIRALDVRNELVFLESFSVGAELPSRFSPFIVARGGLGVVTTDRFGTNQVYLLTSIGAEAGVDAWVSPWLSISPSLGFMRCTINNAYWYSLTFKLAVGF